MSDYLGHGLLFFFLLALSAFFSASEAALFSLGRVRLRSMLDRKHPRAPLLDAMLTHPRRLLVTILVGNELVNIGASIVVASFWDRAVGHAEGFWLVTALSTATALPLIVFFGEVIPKTIAVKNGEAVAAFVSRPIDLFGRLIAPLRWLLRWLAELVTKPFVGHEKPTNPPLSEQDFRALLAVGEKEGVIDADEHKWIRNVMALDEQPIHKVMTPKSAITALPSQMPIPELLDAVREAGYSRIPIYDRNPERIVGVLYAKDILPYAREEGAPAPVLQSLLRPPVFVPRALSVAEVFRELRARRTHLALVVDEFGALDGLVTMEDVLEEIVGEIADERDRDEAIGGRRPTPRVVGKVVDAPRPPKGEGR